MAQILGFVLDRYSELNIATGNVKLIVRSIKYEAKEISSKSRVIQMI